jgi:hypothetical protein
MKKSNSSISSSKNSQVPKFLLSCSLFGLFILLSVILIITAFDVINWDKVFYNELERKTDCLINTNVRIIIAGDSRAEVQLIPLQFEKELHEGTINIGLPACDLATIYNLLKSRKLLEKKKTIVISTSIFQINDNIDDIGYISSPLICRLSLIEKTRMFYKRPEKLFQAYTRAETSLLNRVINRPFLKNASSLYSSEKGFRAVQGEVVATNIYKISLDPGKTQHPWYKNIRLNGAKWRIFKDILDHLGRDPVHVILFQPPASPVWKQHTKGSFIEKAEQEYIEMLDRQVSQYSNIVLFDFYNHSDGLKNEHFFDSQHLNETGAGIFSEMFISKMRSIRNRRAKI